MSEFPERHPWWLRYGVSVLAALTGSGLSAVFVYGGFHLDSSFMLTAVVVTAWFGGFGPGLATLLLTVPVQILLREPVNAWAIHGRNDWAGFIIFLVNCVIICALFRKRYFQRTRTEISPSAVTGGWMWRLDPADGGTVETHSPEFPSLSATRTLALWLETVHPEDRPALKEEIREALARGELITKYRSLHRDGEVRTVSMLGVKMRDEGADADYLVATCLEAGLHENPERLEWSAVTLP